MQVKGAQILNKKAQKVINGGITGMRCYSHSDCDILSSVPGFEHEEFFCFWGSCQIM